MRKFITMLGSVFAIASMALSASAATQMNWDEEYSITKRGQVTYEFLGKGTKAQIITSETNSGNDLTMGGQALLFKGATEINVTSDMENGVLVYNTPVLENDVTYTLDFYCNNATTAKPFTIKIVEYDESGSGSGSDTPVTATPVANGKADLEASKLYSYTATADGTLKITNEYSHGTVKNDNIIYTDAEHQNLLSSVTIGSDGGYPSYEFPVVKDETYYIYFTSPSYITATLTFTESATVDPTPEVKAEEIIAGESFDIDSENPLWVFTPTGTSFYVTSGNGDNFINEGKVVVSKNSDGSDPVSLSSTDALLNGDLIYIFTGLEASTPYYFVYKGDEFSGVYGLVLTEGDYKAPEYKPITAEVPFTMSSTDQYYMFTNTLPEGEFWIESDSKTNLLGNGLQIWHDGSSMFWDWMGFEAVETDNGYVYTGLSVNTEDDGIYRFYYTGTETVSLTLHEGTYGSKEMDLAYVMNEEINASDINSSVELSWGEAVKFIADPDEISIPVTFNYEESAGELTGKYLKLQGVIGGDEPGVGPLAETGDEGTSLFILTGSSELFTKAGTYFFTLPAGIVENADGAINPEQDILITVTSLAEPVSFSPEQNAVIAEGEDVIITITYESEITIEENAEAVVFVVNYNDMEGEDYYEQVFTWADVEVVSLNADKDALVVNLGNELPLGTYELMVYEGVFTVDELDNDMVSYMFTISNTVGVNTIGTALEGNEAIYNLQGVRVDANKLNKGIYIINGKKVMVK